MTGDLICIRPGRSHLVKLKQPYINTTNRCSLKVFLIQVAPGETALAFYTATNPTDSPITGISTYNVVPFEAGQYFNKIQVRIDLCEFRYNPLTSGDLLTTIPNKGGLVVLHSYLQ